jgi:prepilin-type N-terminal cleavage/methylation domain-containing protein
MDRRRKGGFTLIELMTVVIIVGILAVVSIPLYRGQVARARASEGAALLGSVLTAERVYYAEHGEYINVADADAGEETLGVNTDGNKYFTDYNVTDADEDGFNAETVGTGDASTIKVTMDYDGTAEGTGATLSYTYNYEAP